METRGKSLNFNLKSKNSESLAILVILTLVFALSLCSGFVMPEIPMRTAWAVSPLGLIFSFSDFKEWLLDIPSRSSFHFSFGYYPDYFRVFLKTCLIEAPFYGLAFGFLNRRRLILYVLCGNILTHPLIYFLLPAFFEKYLNCALISELVAGGGEALLAWLILRKNSVHPMGGATWILLANFASWQLGQF